MVVAALNATPKSPQVSLVLPVRDGAATVARAIASVRAQTWRDWELLVIDDGSLDATPDIVRRIARDDSRVELLRCGREGIVSALNAGLRAARGPLIARMDADDECHPERLEAQVAFLNAAENHHVGVVGCLVAFGGDRMASAGYALHVDWINSLVTPEEIALNRFVESPFAHPSVMFRREFVDRYGGYRAGPFPEDYELWLRWLEAGVVMAKVPRVLFTWHDPPARSSRTDPRYDPEAFFRVKAEWLARWLERRQVLASRELWVWGAGRPTRKRAAHLERDGLRIAGYIDVDAKKATPALGGTGRPVIEFSALPPVADRFVLGYVTSRGARDFIRAALLTRGYGEGRDFLMCA